MCSSISGTGSSSGSGTSCGGAPVSCSQRLERLAVAADVLAGAAEREQQQVLAGLAVDHLAPDLGRDPDELALAELARLALDDQRERAREHEVDLLLRARGGGSARAGRGGAGSG